MLRANEYFIAQDCPSGTSDTVHSCRDDRHLSFGLTGTFRHPSTHQLLDSVSTVLSPVQQVLWDVSHLRGTTPDKKLLVEHPPSWVRWNVHVMYIQVQLCGQYDPSTRMSEAGSKPDNVRRQHPLPHQTSHHLCNLDISPSCQAIHPCNVGEHFIGEHSIES